VNDGADAVTAWIDVPTDPARAFALFTDDVDAWYVVDANTVFDVTRTVAVRFEPGVGGRLLDVHDAATGEGRELGRVTTWEAGQRLVFVDSHGTEVDVRFDAVAGGTRVTLVHRGLAALPAAEADHVRRHGWPTVLPWFEQFATTGRHASRQRGDSVTPADPAPVGPGPRGLSPYLYYADAGAALDWLARVLGFGESVRYVDPDGVVQEGEIQVGAARLMVSGRAPGPSEGAGLMLIVDVADVDAHHARTVAAGVAADPPVDQPYGPRTYQVDDPWGYHWVMWQERPDHVMELGDLREERVGTR
jgi:uncharacterized glyoxalase superfamily protein PhnB